MSSKELVKTSDNEDDPFSDNVFLPVKVGTEEEEEQEATSFMRRTDSFDRSWAVESRSQVFPKTSKNTSARPSILQY